MVRSRFGNDKHRGVNCLPGSAKEKEMDFSIRFPAGLRLVRIIMAALFIVGPWQLVSARESGDSAVSFRHICVDDISLEFDSAVTLLHSFEYPEAEQSFRKILENHPGCAMARWGLAMSLWHPLWAPPREKNLKEGASILGALEPEGLPPEEAAWLDAISAFYADYQIAPHEQRAERYRSRMEALYRDNPDDPEAAVFYALALLAVADPKDKSYARQTQAAAILNQVAEKHPHHPGVLHYLIHSYDYPELAHLGLPAARVYAKAAPESAHAQHMPSHIFTRLGLWQDSIASNHDSTRAAANYTQRASLPGHYDEGLHSMDYLMYAFLQTAQDNEAKALLEQLRRIGKTHPENFKVAYTYAAVPARYSLERRQWQEASGIVLQPVGFPWSEFGWAVSIHHFARGIGAARSEDLAGARRELDAIIAIRSSLAANTPAYWREEVQVHADALLAWIRLAEAQPDRALELARAAADREDAVDKHPVTPGEVIPARELLADMLLQLKQSGAALAEYRRVLEVSPNRFNALLGAARAAAGEGQDDVANDFYRSLLAQVANDDDSRPGIREARDFMR